MPLQHVSAQSGSNNQIAIDHQNAAQVEPQGTVKLDAHLDVPNPSDFVSKQPERIGRNVVGNVSNQEIETGLQTLKQRKVNEVTRDWTLSGLGLGTVGGAAAGIFGGAALGAMIGGPIGAIVGGVIGGALVMGGFTGAGFRIGKHRGNKQASKITRDTVLQKYDPSGPTFKKLMRDVPGRYEAARIESESDNAYDSLVGLDSHRRSLTPKQEARVRSNLQNLIDARIKLGPPLTKWDVDTMAISLARMECAGVGEPFQQHLESTLSHRIDAHGGPDGELPIDDQFLSDLNSIAATFIEPFPPEVQDEMGFVARDNPGVEESIQQGLKKLLLSTGHAGGLKASLVRRLQVETQAIASHPDLTPDQKIFIIGKISDQLAHRISAKSMSPDLSVSDFATFQDELARNPVVMHETIRGLTAIARELNQVNEARSAATKDDADSPPQQQLDDKELSNKFLRFMNTISSRERGLNDTPRAQRGYLTGMLAIINQGLPAEHEKEALQAYTQGLQADAGAHISIGRGRATSLATAVIETERALEILAKGTLVSGEPPKQKRIRVKPENYESFAKEFRKAVANHVHMAARSEWEQKGVHELAERISNHIANTKGNRVANGDSDQQRLNVYDRERDLDYRADVSVNQFWKTALSANTKSKDTTRQLRLALESSYLHQSVRKSGGELYESDQESIYAKGAGMTFAERFENRLTLGLKTATGGDPKVAKAAYQKLMGADGEFRAALMMGNLYDNDVRGGGNGDLTRDVAKDYFGIGVEQAVRSLADVAGISEQDVNKDLQSIKDAARKVQQETDGRWSVQVDIKGLAGGRQNVRDAITQDAGIDLDALSHMQHDAMTNLPKLMAAKVGSEIAERDLANRLGLERKPNPGALDDPNYVDPSSVQSNDAASSNSNRGVSSPSAQNDSAVKDKQFISGDKMTDREIAQAFDWLLRAGAGERESWQWIMTGIVDRGVLDQIQRANDNAFQSGQDRAIVDSLRATSKQLDRFEIKEMAKASLRQKLQVTNAGHFGLQGDLTLKPAMNDGDCFFHAIASQTGRSMQDVRNSMHSCATDIVQQQKGVGNVHGIDVYDVAGTPVPKLLLDEDVSDQVIRQPARTGGANSWASEFHAAIAAQVFQRPVVVFSYNQATHHVDTNVYGSGLYGDKQPIMLTYDGVNHFDGVGKAE